MNHTGRVNPHQRTLRSFGLNMVVMALSFMLYYLGLFGTVEGPLNINSIARTMADAGISFTRDDLQIVLITLCVIALTWNWILNMVARQAGWNYSCIAGKKEPCGQLARRSRDENGQGWIYTCASGHKETRALFRPIRKGKVAICLLMVALASCVMFYVR